MVKDEQLRQMAKDRVGFKTHFFIYIAVNIFLFAINAVSSPGSWWFYWTTIPWGFGVLMHYISVYVLGGKAGEETRVEEEYKKLKAKQM